MTAIHAQSALLPGGWRKNVRLAAADGAFAAVEAEAAARPGDERHAVVVPGMANLHSHAFQRGMAGLAEVRGPGPDSFWSWRKTMYDFALAITPDEAEAVAARVYMEMLESGFTRVGEFHYLHHDRDGRRYADIAEMAGRIAAAASGTGIGLTLLPVFYAHAGFGGMPPRPEQRRFVSDRDAFADLLAGCRALARDVPRAVVGVAPHSLRAVTPAELAAVAALAEGAGPIHIHVAEQVGEVEDCVAWSGARPVEWLLDHAEIDGRWCLIHATHMTDAETRRMARQGAIAGLCPITEANLGDGIFPAAAFLGEGGRFGVGTDSNVLIGLPDELRQLEYSQRLLHRARNVLAAPNGSTGRSLVERAAAGGAAALGAGDGGIAVGSPADFVSLEVCEMLPLEGDQMLDGWIFGSAVKVDCVWAGGRKCVEAGRHAARNEIAARFGKAMRGLLARR